MSAAVRAPATPGLRRSVLGALVLLLSAGVHSAGADGQKAPVRDTRLDVSQFATSPTDGPGFDAAVARAQAIGAENGAPPAEIDVPPARYVPNGFKYKDSRINWLAGSSRFGNTAHGIEQHVNTLYRNWAAAPDDTYHADRYFDAQVKDWGGPDPKRTNGYNKAGAVFSGTTSFGKESPAVGTPLGFMHSMLVYDTATPDVGLNEAGGLYNYIEAVKGRSQPATNYWLQDNILTSGQQLEHWIGASIRVHKMAAGTATDATHAGSVGQSIVTRPLLPGEASTGGSREGDSTYPLTAGLAIAGFSGVLSSGRPLTSGLDPRAGYGFETGIQVGGALSPYLAYDARSKFATAVRLSDYAVSALSIEAPHPSFDRRTGSAIAVARGAGLISGLDGFRGTLRTPRSSAEPCTAGEFADDPNYHYVCTAANHWKRVALSDF